MNFTDWVQEGALRARFGVAPTGSKRSAQLIKEINQPDRDQIMRNTALMRDEAEGTKMGDMSFGRLVGRIPIVDFLRLEKTHPDLFSPDVETARKATIKFFNSSEGAQYRIRKA